MKVRMKVEVSGSRDGQPWPPRGGVVDLPKDEAVQLCRNGMAVPVGGSSDEVETAVVHEPEERRTALITESAKAVTPVSPSTQEKEADADKAVEEKPQTPARRGPGRPRKTAASKPESGEK